MRFQAPMVLLLGLMLTGCVTHGSIANKAVDFNLAVEQAQNQMLLLNAVRASERRPMYITGVQTVTGNVTTEASASLEVPFGKGTAEYKVSPSVSYSENPTFEVPVFETKEFMLGFLNPIQPKILAYYWDQGWPRSLLLHLLVERIRIKGEVTPKARQDGGTIGNPIPFDEVFENDPEIRDGQLCHFLRYGRFVDLLIQEGKPVLEVTETQEDVKGAPALSRTEIGGLGSLLAARKENLVLREDGNTPPAFHLQVNKEEVGFTIERAARERVLQYALEIEPSCGTQPYVGTREQGKMMVMVKGEEEKVQPGDGRVDIELSLRSPEAVLYYLGELIRAEADGKMPSFRSGDGWEPIFVARKVDRSCKEGVVDIRYDGAAYLVPPRQKREPEPESSTGEYEPPPSELLAPGLACDGGRSMQALSLVSQLIALQKSAEDLPSSKVIRTIGN